MLQYDGHFNPIFANGPSGSGHEKRGGGFGRIGKVLAKMLNGIGANVWCEARREEDLAWIKAYGYKGIHLDKLNENAFVSNKGVFVAKLLLSKKAVQQKAGDTYKTIIAPLKITKDAVLLENIKIK